MKSHYQYDKSIAPLEYATILSGMAMAGDDVSDRDIEFARHLHQKDKAKKFSFSAYLGGSKHSV